MRCQDQSGWAAGWWRVRTEWSRCRAGGNGNGLSGWNCDGCDRTLRKPQAHQRHAKTRHWQQEHAGDPGQAGHAGRQVDDPEHQASHGKPEVSEVHGRRGPGTASAGAAEATADDPPCHHHKAKTNGDQPCGKGDQTERGTAGRAGRRCGHRRQAGLRRNRSDHTPQQRGQFLRAGVDAHSAVHRAEDRPKRIVSRRADLGFCQATAGRWERGDGDVMLDGTDAELGTRFHPGQLRARGLMRAPGGEKRSKYDSCHGSGRQGTVPPRGQSHPHVAKSINLSSPRQTGPAQGAPASGRTCGPVGPPYSGR